jgi:hypothetical protein
MHSRASAARRSPLGSRYGSSPKNWTEKRDRRDNANQKQSHAGRASLLVIQPQASSHCGNDSARPVGLLFVRRNRQQQDRSTAPTLLTV